MRRIWILAGAVLLLVLAAVLWSGERQERAPVAPREPNAQGTQLPDAVRVRDPVDVRTAADEPTADDEAGSWCGFAEQGANGKTWLELREIIVVSAADGSPIEGALVRCDIRFPQYLDDVDAPLTRAVHTDAAGSARIPRSSDSLEWWVRAEGYLLQTPEVESRTDTVRIVLQPAAPLPGIVVDAASGLPIAGVEVRAQWADRRWVVADTIQTTGADGGFTICGVPADTPVELIARHAGLGSVKVDVAAYADRAELVTLSMGRGANVSGVVRDAKGDAVAGADVYVAACGEPTPLRPPGDNWDETFFARTRTTTSAGGEYTIRGVVVPASVVVYARAPSGEEGQSASIALPNNDTAVSTDLVVTRLVAVRVELVDSESGEQLPTDDARLTLDAEYGDARDDQQAGRAAENDETSPHFAGVSPGHHVLHIRSPRSHLDPAPLGFETASAGVTTVTATIDRGRTVTGRVLDSSGNPVAVYVTFAAVWKGVEQYPNTRSEDDGHFRLEGVPPVAGELRAFGDGHGRTTWNDIEIAGDLGDLVLEQGAKLVGRLPAEFRGRSIAFGVQSVRGGHSSGFRVGEDGRFVIDSIPTGRPCTVYVRADGYAAFVLRDLVLGTGETRDLGEIAFPEPLTFDGTLVDADGAPVVGAIVRTVEWWTRDHPRTNTEGCFTMTTLPPGPLTLWIETSEDAVHFERVSVQPGMQAITVRLAATGRIRCSFTREAGAPFSGQPVNVYRLLDNDEADWSRRIIPRTDSRGVLELDLYPGHYGLQPHSSSGVDPIEPSPTFEIKPGETIELTLPLD